MKIPSLLLPLLAVLLAAVAGYEGGRRRCLPATPPSGEDSRPARGGVETAGAAAPVQGEATAGPVKKWADRLRNSPVDELPGLFEEIQTIIGAGLGTVESGVLSPAEASAIHRERQTALRLLCARWAELDAPGGLAFFMGREDGVNGRSWLLTEWALRDPRAAYEAVLELPEKDRRGEVSSVGRQLMEEGDKAFPAWFRLTRRPFPSAGAEERFWTGFAAAHPDELLALGTELLADPKTVNGENEEMGLRHGQLDYLYTLLGGTLAGKDAGKALEWAKNQPGTVRRAAVVGVLKTLAAVSPDTIVEPLALLTPVEAGGNMSGDDAAGSIVARAVGTMCLRNPLKGAEWLSANKEKLGIGYSNGLHALTTRFAGAILEGELSARDAVSAILAVCGQEYPMGVMRGMCRGLPAERLSEAARWLLTADSQADQRQALGEIFLEWMGRDRAAALEFAAGVEDPGLAAHLYQSYVSGACGGPFHSQSTSMAAALEDIPPPFRAAQVASGMWAYGGPMGDFGPPFDGAAMARTLDGLPPSADLDGAVTSVAAVWGTWEAERAIAWAAGQKDPGLREKAIGAAMESWAREDAWGASQWLDAQPGGEPRDMAARCLAQALGTGEPESAWI